MQLILLSKKGSKALSFSLTRKVLVVAALVISTLVMLLLGYLLNSQYKAALLEQQTTNEFAKQRLELQQLKQKTRNTLDGLAIRVGQIQSSLLHLNAVGEHLAKKARLSPSEFNFNALAAQGGLKPSENSSLIGESELLTEIQQLDQKMVFRRKQLEQLDKVMLEKGLAKKVRPAGLPAEKGWVSSYFGYRTDPFNGRKAFHHGVDVAGREGTNVFSVASGIVSSVGKRNGYGVLVEVEHADGFVTRYAHNKQSLVKVGDLVKQGQSIAKMGSTGRSTGPHVHFEVIKNGKKVNPKKYLYTAR